MAFMTSKSDDRTFDWKIRVEEWKVFRQFLQGPDVKVDIELNPRYFFLSTNCHFD